MTIDFRLLWACGANEVVPDRLWQRAQSSCRAPERKEQPPGGANDQSIRALTVRVYDAADDFAL